MNAVRQITIQDNTIERVLQLLKQGWRANPALSWQIAFSASCLWIAILGLAFYHGTINAEHAWVKPFKFSLSLLTYGVTLLMLAKLLKTHQKLFRIVCRTALFGTVIELSAIILQVMRGTTSHFNTSTQFDQVVFGVTTSAILLVAGGMIVLYVILLKKTDLPPVLGTALRWGFFLSIVGLLPGLLMIMPDSLQELITHGQPFDGHTIGYADGGAGLTFLGWSTVAGDLRPAHFVGLHALQLFPILACFIARFHKSLSARDQQKLLWTVGVMYLGVMSIMILQALAGESVVSPSAVTLGALGVVFWFGILRVVAILLLAKSALEFNTL